MGELPHVRDANPSEADDEDGWAESSTHEAVGLTSEVDRTRKHPFYVIWVHGTASQYCFQAQANKRFQLRLGISERSHSPTDQSQGPMIAVCLFFHQLPAFSKVVHVN
jgi:hypothetical protein